MCVFSQGYRSRRQKAWWSFDFDLKYRGPGGVWQRERGAGAPDGLPKGAVCCPCTAHVASPSFSGPPQALCPDIVLQLIGSGQKMGEDDGPP